MSAAEVCYQHENEFLFVKLFRDVSREEMNDLLDEITGILEGKPGRRLMADLSAVPGLQMNAETRGLLKEKAAELDVERMAVVGASPVTRMLAKIVTTVLGIRSDTRFFRTVDEARDWITGQALARTRENKEN